MLASCSNDKTVRIWNPSTWEQTHILTGHHNVVVDFSYDSLLLASCSFDKTICLWNVRNSILQRRLRYSDIVYSVVFGPNGLLANSAEDGAVRIWQTEVIEG
jgi:WD40 repeat protein